MVKFQKDKIVIEEKIGNPLVLFLGSLVFVVIGVLMFLSGEKMGLAVILLFGLGLVASVIGMFSKNPKVDFSQENIVLQITTQAHTIPWQEIKEIGVQKAEVTTPEGILAYRYLVLTFKEPSAYKFNFIQKDLELIKDKDQFKDFAGDFKGDLYIAADSDLADNLDKEKRVQDLIDEFPKKVAHSLKTFPFLSKKI